MVQGSRYKVQGTRFRIQGARFRVQGARCKVYYAFRVQEQAQGARREGKKLIFSLFRPGGFSYEDSGFR
jgi:predicted adenine nucleotide alpha hydrolase (AANH) superfamily ATPase